MSARHRPARPRALAGHWGFHRLSPEAARHVVARSGVGVGDLVVDLGAGDGVLTAALLATGARVVAVELHPDRIQVLRRRFAGAPVTVVGADVGDVRLPRRPFRVVANPPWSRAESIRAQLLRAPCLVRADLVLPRWLVQRWSQASPRIQRGSSLRAESFVPRAPTGSAVAVVHGPRRTPM